MAETSEATLATRLVAPDRALLDLSGVWLSRSGLPDPAAAVRDLARMQVRAIGFDTRAVTAWDSGLVTFVMKVLAAAGQAGIVADRDGLPDGVRRLIALAESVPERQTSRGGAR